MKFSIVSLLTVVSTSLAYTYNTSDIIAYNVSKAVYHYEDVNITDYDYWSLAVTNTSLSSANGTNITVALIGDGVNSHYLLSESSLDSVIDVHTNKTYKFSEAELTEDTLAAKVLLANAPAATIKSYKIFESKNSTRSDNKILTKAMIAAANDDDVDIILLNTWQMYGGWEGSYFSKFADSIAQVKPLVVPMGQTNGIFQFSDGAGAENAISVGGSGYEGEMGFAIDINHTIFPMYAKDSLSLWANSKLELRELGDDCYLTDNETYTPESILFLDVGNCTADQVVDAMLNSHFIRLLTTGEEIQYYTLPSMNHMGGGMLRRSDGLDILHRLQNGEEIYAHSMDSGVMVVIDPDYDEYSINFNSSFGPTLDVGFKPNVLAQSAVYFDDIEVFGSGTGFSAAFVAGNLAAYASLYKDDSWTNGLIDKVTTSGTQVNFRDLNQTYSEIHNPVVQGGGIFNVEEFISKDFTVSPGYFSLGETNKTETISFTITNDAAKERRFLVSGLDAITLYSQKLTPTNSDENMYRYPIVGNKTSSSEVILDDSTIVLAAGESKNVTATVIPPNFDGEQIRVPIFGGYIQVTDLETDAVSSIPYMGTTVLLNNVTTQTLSAFYWKAMWWDDEGSRWMDMWEDGQVLNDTDHWLQMYWATSIGSQIVDIMVVEKDWTKEDFVYPPVPGEDKFVDHIKGTRYIGSYPWYYVSRTNTSVEDEHYDNWFGRLADGSLLDEGDYKIVLRVLNHNGNASNWDDWYNHVSPWFTFNYANVTEVDFPHTTITISHSATTLMTSSKALSMSSSKTTST